MANHPPTAAPTSRAAAIASVIAPSVIPPRPRASQRGSALLPLALSAVEERFDSVKPRRSIPGQTVRYQSHASAPTSVQSDRCFTMAANLKAL